MSPALQIHSVALNTGDCKTFVENRDRDKAYTCFAFYNTLRSASVMVDNNGDVQLYPLLVEEIDTQPLQQESLSLMPWERLRSVRSDPRIAQHLDRVHERRRERVHRQKNVVFDASLVAGYSNDEMHRSLSVLALGNLSDHHGKLLITGGNIYAWDFWTPAIRKEKSASALVVQHDAHSLLHSLKPSAESLVAPAVMRAELTPLSNKRVPLAVSMCQSYDATVLYLPRERVFTCENRIFSRRNDALTFELSPALRLAEDGSNAMGGPPAP